MIATDVERPTLNKRTKALLAAALAGSALGMMLSRPLTFTGSSAHATSLKKSPATKNFNDSIATNEKQITISAIGDCVLGTDDRFIQDASFDHYRNTLHEPDGYFFSGVRDILDHDDLTIAIGVPWEIAWGGYRVQPAPVGPPVTKKLAVSNSTANR